jgi:catechol 2,3-dioxygenase-like lactoylglutathione lyase family enzyme
MACRISELVLNCRDPSRLAAFWCEVLGYAGFTRDADSIEIGPVGTGFGGLQPTIVFQAHPAPTPGLLRLHFDVSPVGGDQDAELARLLAAGARPADVGQRGDEGWHVLADPEGNEFCLLRRQLET